MEFATGKFAGIQIPATGTCKLADIFLLMKCSYLCVRDSCEKSYGALHHSRPFSVRTISTGVQVASAVSGAVRAVAVKGRRAAFAFNKAV